MKRAESVEEGVGGGVSAGLPTPNVAEHSELVCHRSFRVVIFEISLRRLQPGGVISAGWVGGGGSAGLPTPTPDSDETWNPTKQ